MGVSTSLAWSPYPSDFEFINTDLDAISVPQHDGMITITTGGPPTPTPTPVSISGSIVYCSNPTPVPVPNVLLSLTGSASSTALSNGSGDYTFPALIAGGNYTVTPSKIALTIGSAGINTVDVIAVQRHYLGVALLNGCRLTAADVNENTVVNTVDVIAVQRFYLGLASGTASVGKYQFSPVSRSYNPLIGSQTSQNYDAVIFGDVAPPFVTP